MCVFFCNFFFSESLADNPLDSATNLFNQAASNINDAVSDGGKVSDLIKSNIGLFKQCTDPTSLGDKKFFEGKSPPFEFGGHKCESRYGRYQVLK